MRIFFQFLFYTILLFWTLSVHAKNPLPPGHDSRTFSIYFENDLFAGRDDQYTNGIKLTWSRHGLSELPDDALLYRWLYPVVKLLGFASPDSEKAVTFSVGQNIYTPEDIESTALIMDDRPYAGITYIDMGFHRKHENQMHTYGLCVGIIGPHSYAEKIQNEVHNLMDFSEAKGWDHQLKDELVMSLVYDYKKKVLASGINNGYGGDMIINAGGSLGTVRTFGNIGLSVRYGWNVPNDCGNFPIQPATCFNAESVKAIHKNNFGAHIFASASTQVVLRDIFLDGNTFRDSHSVDKKPVIGIFMGGIGLTIDKVKAVFAYVVRTKSFKTQEDPEIYGSISLSFRY